MSASTTSFGFSDAKELRLILTDMRTISCQSRLEGVDMHLTNGCLALNLDFSTSQLYEICLWTGNWIAEDSASFPKMTIGKVDTPLAAEAGTYCPICQLPNSQSALPYILPSNTLIGLTCPGERAGQYFRSFWYPRAGNCLTCSLTTDSDTDYLSTNSTSVAESLSSLDAAQPL